MADVKAIFYLPVRDNDGRTLMHEIARVRDELFRMFAGWTSLGYVKGAFRVADGSRSLDTSAAYMVVLDESRMNELESDLRNFKRQTTQEAIYMEVHRDIDIRFVR
ncbi:MAG: hypothetical protein U0744_21350 [Gemmataceae bacterium]